MNFLSKISDMIDGKVSIFKYIKSEDKYVLFIYIFYFYFLGIFLSGK